MKSILVLEDGSVFEGKALGLTGTAWGELVFTTGMTGYQETITDPSYAGQIVVMTYPLIGNYGFFEEFTESERPALRGLVVREAWGDPQGGSGENLDGYLKRHGIIGIEGIDTRALAKKIKDGGVMKAVISTELEEEEALKLLHEVPALEDQELVKAVTTKEIKTYGREDGMPVAVLDLGAKKSIVKSLVERGFRVTVFPADTPAKVLVDFEPVGVVISNGPGNPKKADYAVKTTRDLLGKLPLFGICLGHQIIALALGANTYKLKFGHRGCNHPVKDLRKDKVYITSQNHGFAVDSETLPEGAEVTFVNVNDGTVEGLWIPKYSVFSVQFHPEASPGPLDMGHLFDEFIALAKGGIENA
ncbi:Carbamoyl-phosphate synthase small chain [Fervidicola ferrireducens]|uniref:Carbamoyl phosphate synthase small chain n=1 Tax=Fervidicola ferrireducens TaxID=520764 RepID=A0A140L4D6_9FIRM|nr:glutamine-hydrolyzing carbamoyl-phosphate synthase small subunit [Fervidicola ferrireducens]KXG75411.1 Carbamoyl-phosphate synthase small chain [Fervidicola ferrireducens]